MNSNNFDKKKLKILDLYKKQKYTEVIKIGLDLYNNQPNDHQLTYILGLTSINLKNFIEAEKYFEKLISVKKTYQLYYIFGNIQKKLKKFENSISSFENAIKLNPNFSEAYNSLGNAKKLLDFGDEAEECYRKAISLKEDNIEALFNLTNILKEKKKYKDLILAYHQLLKLDKENVKTNYNLGSAYLFLGDTSKACEYFKKVIDIDHKHLPSYRNYISVTKIDKKNNIFKKLKDINIDELEVEDKILSFTALSKCYFDLDQISLGFSFLNKSNQLKKDKSKFSMNDEKKKFEKIKFFYKNSEISNLKFEKNLNKIPVFIVGMPRSGTTLTEQILDSHSLVHGAGELRIIEEIAKRYEISNYSQKDFLVNKETLKKFQEDYFEEIKPLNIDNKPYFVDKMPGNYLFVSLIKAALPWSKIIHCKRNPMDTCLSIYTKKFVADFHAFYSLDGLARSYISYSDLMQHWYNEFEENTIFDVTYEKLLDNPEEKVRGLLSYLGLEYEDNCLEFYKNDRFVKTASSVQVRKKLYNTSVERWKNYEQQLTPLYKELKQAKIV